MIQIFIVGSVSDTVQSGVDSAKSAADSAYGQGKGILDSAKGTIRYDLVINN